MADTGWLKARSTTVFTDPSIPGNPWDYGAWISQYSQYGAWAFVKRKTVDTPENIESSRIAWDWVIPTSVSAAGDMVVTGIELKLYAGQFQHNKDIIPGADCAWTEIQLGSATLLDVAVADGLDVHYYPNVYYRPGGSLGPDPNSTPVWPITVGGAGQLFDLPANTKLSTFLGQKAVSTSLGNVHATARYGLGPPVDGSKDVWARLILQYVEMKIYYEPLAAEIDIASTPTVSITSTSNAQVIKRLGATALISASVATASLGGAVDLLAAPLISTLMGGDISVDGYIDSTAFPEVVISIPPANLNLLRYIDMQASPGINLELDPQSAGLKINLAASLPVNVTLTQGFVHIVDMRTEPDINVEIFQPVLYSEYKLASAPFIDISVTAAMQGDIYLGSGCEDAIAEVVVTLAADLGYTKGLNSTPGIFVTMEPNGLATKVSVVATPLISVTLSKINLKSKFWVPAPDHRTVFKCPDNRTFQITRKDKTIL